MLRDSNVVLIRRYSSFIFGGYFLMSYMGAAGTPVLDFWWYLLWVSKPEWVLQYSRLVLHIANLLMVSIVGC